MRNGVSDSRRGAASASCAACAGTRAAFNPRPDSPTQGNGNPSAPVATFPPSIKLGEKVTGPCHKIEQTILRVAEGSRDAGGREKGAGWERGGDDSELLWG